MYATSRLAMRRSAGVADGCKCRSSNGIDDVVEMLRDRPVALRRGVLRTQGRHV
jgi:hypothetical protein